MLHLDTVCDTKSIVVFFYIEGIEHGIIKKDA